MRAAGYFVAGALFATVFAAIPKAIAHLHPAIPPDHGSEHPTGQNRAHTHEEFAFTANGTMEQAAPLFGADGERVWVDSWDPQFLFPRPGSDKQGMVFTIDRHGSHAVWVNTEFDLKNGRMQYVYVVPSVMASLITLRLAPSGDKTEVTVIYERTSLSMEADDRVRQMAEADREAGPKWEEAINRYLGKARL